MRPADAQARIIEIAPLLHAPELGEKLREYSRYGLPGSSMTDGRGSSEPPLPTIGKTDRQIRLHQLEAEQALRSAVLALETYLRIQNSYLIPTSTDSKKLAALAGQHPCGNPYCERTVSGEPNDRLRKIDGVPLCRRCYRFEMRTKRRWTQALEDATPGWASGPTITAGTGT